jgi:hypothetical protein
MAKRKTSHVRNYVLKTGIILIWFRNETLNVGGETTIKKTVK